MNQETLRLRPVRPDDVEALISMGRVAFAEEHRARGLTPDDFAAQVRAMTRGRMLPARALMALGRVKWGLLIAELDGRIVGCAGYSGRGNQVNLHTSMVAPDYRRRGIATALLRRRLAEIEAAGVRWARAEVLATNVASLGNLQKQGFAEVNRTIEYERALPAPERSVAQAPRAYKVTAADREQIVDLAQQSATSDSRDGVTVADFESDYFQPLARRAFQRLTGVSREAWRFQLGDQLVGYMAVAATDRASKGSASTPLIVPGNEVYLPTIISRAEQWFQQRGKVALKITVSASNNDLRSVLEGAGYEPRATWVSLVRAVRE